MDEGRTSQGPTAGARGDGSDGPTAPPGWYPAPDGRVWWWDGHRWLLPAPERPVDPSLGILPHLGWFVAPVVGAVVVLLTLGKRDALVRHHAAEAVNAQIWFLVGYAVGFIAWVAVVLGASVTRTDAVFALGVVVWVGLLAVTVVSFALSIVGAVRAGQHRFWRYPALPYRFVGGSRSER